MFKYMTAQEDAKKSADVQRKREIDRFLTFRFYHILDWRLLLWHIKYSLLMMKKC